MDWGDIGWKDRVGLSIISMILDLYIALCAHHLL